MSKKYLGFICFIYSAIIFYVWISGLLRNFLAPNMQLYLKISAFVFIPMGLVLLFNNRVNYKFKISDLILLLPIVLLIIAGDGRLTASLANNRFNNIKIRESNSCPSRAQRPGRLSGPGPSPRWRSGLSRR